MMGSDDDADHMDRNLTRPDLNQPTHRVESLKGCKRDNSHLVEKAPDIDSEVKKSESESKGSFFDCNICLELAKEPVLTCCGHLFCWACFYQVSNVATLSKECPVCKGKVSDTAVTPIYGNGDSEGIRVTESGLHVPPRPKGRRVESVRQRVTQPSFLFPTPISDSLIRNETSQERMVDDLGSVINNQRLANETLVDVGSDSPGPTSVIRSIEYTIDPTSFVLRRRRRMN